MAPRLPIMGRSLLGRIAAWTDDNPLRAAGIVVAAGAAAGLLVDAGAADGGQTGAGGATAAATATTAAATVAETALARPAYVVVALVGLAVFAAYDG